MLFATELVGASAYDSQAHFVGRVREFFVEPAEQPNRISHFLISRGRFQPLVARYDQVSKVAPGRIDLNVSERALDAYRPNEAWLAVQKDLLDQQIIDTAGRKVVRVNDVDLTEIRTNEHVELRIAQVDVGLPGAMRRLLQGIAPSSVVRKLQAKLPQRSIRWEFVNLIEPDPLRRVKLRITHEKLEDLHPADLAEMMEELSAAERQGIIASLDEETAEELLEEMPGQEASEVRGLMAFDENTAGGMMNPEFVFVGETATREEVLKWMRSQDLNVDQLDTIVLLDSDAKFSGTVPVARLLLADAEQRMAELKTEPLLGVPGDADEGDVFELFDKYNLRMLAVTNTEGRPIGTITVDDVVSRLVKK